MAAATPQRRHTPQMKRALEARDKDPRNVDAWLFILREIERWPVHDARPEYEACLEQFPTASLVWKQYITHELRSRDFEHVVGLFKRCLVDCPNLDIWMSYIDFLHESGKSRDELQAGYDFALSNVGQDNESTKLWQRYIRFLQEIKPESSYDAQQKSFALRRAYKQAVTSPKANIEGLWRDFTQFEHREHKTVAKKILDDTNKEYSLAREASVVLEQKVAPLDKNLMPRLPSKNPSVLRQKQLWQDVIRWEKTNPLKLVDPNVVVARVYFAYQQYLRCFANYSTAWYEAARYLVAASAAANKRGDAPAAKKWENEAKNTLAKGANVLKTDFFIHFAYADFLEQHNLIDQAKQVYENLIKNEGINPTMAYVQYMRFVRRSQDIMAMRNVFKKARKDPRVGHQVFVASALMELNGGDKGSIVCKNIFELGLSKFSDNPDFVLAYIDFLAHLGDTSNTRALFERALSSVPAEKAAPVWARYEEFESNFGSLQGISKVEERSLASQKERVQEATGDGGGHPQTEDDDDDKAAELEMLVRRYRFMDLQPCDDLLLKIEGVEVKNEGVAAEESGEQETSQAEAATFSPFPRPDLSQLQAYVPKRDDPAMTMTRPPSLVALMKLLPPPSSYDGPKVKVDMLLREILNRPITVPAGVEVSEATGARKRGLEDDDDTNAAEDDIYRKRQKAKLS